MEPPSKDFRPQLHAYDPRRGAPPTNDCAEAAEAALADPQLRQWWDNEQACDTALCRKIREAGARAPEDLKTRILAAAAHEGVSPNGLPRFSWHWATFAGAAAAVMMAALFFTFLFEPTPAEASPELDLVIVQLEDMLNRAEAPMHRSESFDALVAHLESTGAPLPKVIPAGLSQEDGYACANLKVREIPVGMLCFDVDGELVHVFAIQRDSLPNQKDIPEPVLRRLESHSCATWTADDQIFVLATKAPAHKLRQLL